MAASVSFQDSNISMEQLLNDSEIKVTDISPGNIVNGKVAGFHPDESNPEFVIVSMGTKSEGKLSIREFDDKPQIGDDVEALVKNHEPESGFTILSKRDLERRRGWEVVSESFEKQVPVIGTVKRQMKQGYLVNVEGLAMFLPHSHVGSLTQTSRKGRKPEVIGSTFSFKILEIDYKKKTGVVSRKDFLEQQNASRWEELVDKLHIGDVVKGRVIKHMKMGAFVEVEGVLGFLHKSNISWDRHNDNFKDKVPLDSEIDVRILEVDPENNRLSLGLKQLTEDPWSSVEKKYKVGDIVTGKVTFVANYGAFIDIGEGIEGLLHVSEMSWTRKVNHAREVVKVDQEISTKIIGINAGEKRISLGLRQMQENPWASISATLKVGETMKGRIKDVTNFGVFVAITDEIDGLVRKEDVDWEEPANDPRKNYKSGDEVSFKIIEINAEDKKIGCSIRHLLPNPYKQLRDKYPRGSVISGVVSGVVDFGVFVRFDEKYEGLVHVSAMGKEQAANPKKSFNKGDEVKVVVRAIDPENRKISLSIKDVEYAMERMEISRYITKDEDKPATGNPFGDLRSYVFPKSL